MTIRTVRKVAESGIDMGYKAIGSLAFTVYLRVRSHDRQKAAEEISWLVESNTTKIDDLARLYRISDDETFKLNVRKTFEELSQVMDGHKDQLHITGYEHHNEPEHRQAHISLTKELTVALRDLREIADRIRRRDRPLANAMHHEISGVGKRLRHHIDTLHITVDPQDVGTDTK